MCSDNPTNEQMGLALGTIKATEVLCYSLCLGLGLGLALTDLVRHCLMLVSR